MANTRSKTKRAASPTKKVVTRSAGKRPASPTKKAASPVKKAASPAKRPMSPTKKAAKKAASSRSKKIALKAAAKKVSTKPRKSSKRKQHCKGETSYCVSCHDCTKTFNMKITNKTYKAVSKHGKKFEISRCRMTGRCDDCQSKKSQFISCP